MNTTEVVWGGWGMILPRYIRIILTNQSKDPKPLTNQDDSIPYRIDGTKGIIYLPTTSNLPLQKKTIEFMWVPTFQKPLKKPMGFHSSSLEAFFEPLTNPASWWVER